MTAKTPAERQAAKRARLKAAGLPDSTRRRDTPAAKARREREAAARWARSKATARPFVGCDGEGWGEDQAGRQHYMLFRMGERELWTGNPLGTIQLLDFILDHPAGADRRGPLLVVFNFGYDVTQILRDLPPGQAKRLFPDPRGEDGEPRRRIVYWRDYDIEYLPKNYLRVKRVRIVQDPAQPSGERREPVKGSMRTLYDVFGCFQRPFAKVAADYGLLNVGKGQALKAGKRDRRRFAELQPAAIRRYCALECDTLAEIMERFRADCLAVGIRPRTWSGAGKLAQALHIREGTLTARELAGLAERRPKDGPDLPVRPPLVPPPAEALAEAAYYGGRFETAYVGHVGGPVTMDDLHSAYPAAMTRLPCLRHATWSAFEGAQVPPGAAAYLARAAFRQAASGPAGGRENWGQLGTLPVRRGTGTLYFPRQGQGVYWSAELESARRRGARIRLHGGWSLHVGCDCRPFAWIEGLYAERQALKAAGAGGDHPLKMALASLYGKLAQRQGLGRFSNLVHAGLVTAATRAAMNDAVGANEAAHGPGRVVMVATDALYTLDPTPGLDLGEGLGQWERKGLADLFIVQPGLYWDRAKRTRKSKGLSGKFFEDPGRTESFEAAWSRFQRGDWKPNEEGRTYPLVSVNVPGADPLQVFLGLRLASAQGHLERAGRWEPLDWRVDFDPGGKRTGLLWEGAAVVTRPKPGAADTVSVPYGEAESDAFEAGRAQWEDMPDPVDLGPAWED